MLSLEDFWIGAMEDTQKSIMACGREVSRAKARRLRELTEKFKELHKHIEVRIRGVGQELLEIRNRISLLETMTIIKAKVQMRNFW